MRQELERKIEKLNIPGIRKHIFLCCDQSKPKCCSYEQSVASWGYLKKRIDELKANGIDDIYRTKANCLRVCTQGPIAVVYPDRVWYHSCTPEVLAQIVEHHLLNDTVVEEYVLWRP